VQKKQWQASKLTISTGIGYSMILNRFTIPAQNQYFGIRQYIIIHNENYFVHNIQVPISIKYNIYKSINVGPSFIYNHYVMKKMDALWGGGLESFKFTPFSMHGFLSSTYNYNKFIIGMDYGIWNGKWRDNALANDGKDFDSNRRGYYRFSLGYYIK
jgi:hypothetical protein